MNEKIEKSEEKKSKADDGLAATVRKQGETIQKLKNVLERLFGIDIDRDGKIGALAILLSLSACLAFGAPQSTNTLWNVVDSTASNDVAQVDKFGNLKVDGGITAAGALVAVGGSFSGNVAVTGEFELASTTLAVTNGQIITLSSIPVIKVSAAGQGAVTTTNTLAAVGATLVGNTYYIVNVGASNGVLVADSAPSYNSGVTLGQYDVSVYHVVDTNVIVQTGTINN